MNRAWPNPSDTALDRARAIARSYRAALLEAAPTRCLPLDRAAEEFGETWITARPDLEPGKLVSTADAAVLCGVRETTVRDWASRQGVPVHRYPGGYDPEELLAYRASQRRRRGHR